MNNEPALLLEGLGKTYTSGGRPLTVLQEVNLRLAQGESCSIVGPSGSGKTTLLALAAGLDRPSTGRVLLEGRDLGQMDEDQLADLRRRKIGFVFQTFQLLPTLTALENVMVPAELLEDPGAGERALELLQRVGLEERIHHYPAQLSGGEQQRVALARAFINRPRLLFADEPTGNLDAETAVRVTELLFSLQEDFGTTLLLVTHNVELAERCDRMVTLRGGRIAAEIERRERVRT
ncbi:MAG: ABC transporter ATP-binding protein [Acidobacteriota bacterium]